MLVYLFMQRPRIHDDRVTETHAVMHRREAWRQQAARQRIDKRLRLCCVLPHARVTARKAHTHPQDGDPNHGRVRPKQQTPRRMLLPL